jgi:hypothetical protein
MGVFILMVFVLVLGPLALVYGVDSRRSDGRSWWPGDRRAH